MRKLFNEFFYIPKHGKVREKVMLTRLATTITIVIMCLAAMSITAYAYFSYNITSGSNIIRSATFKTEVQVQITDSNGKAVDTNISPITSDHKSFDIKGLTVGEAYTVSIKPINDETAAKTGFVIVSADGCPDTYYTQQLGTDEKVEGGRTPELSFQLIITDSTTIHLKAHWGTSSHYADFQNKAEELYVTQGEKVTLTINGKDLPKVESNGEPEANTGTNEGTTTTPPAESTTPPATQTDSTATETPTAFTTTPESTGTSEPATTTEPATTETTTPSEQTDPVDTTEPQVTTETQPTEETTGTTPNEASE